MLLECGDAHDVDAYRGRRCQFKLVKLLEAIKEGVAEVLLVGVVFFAWAYTESVDGNVKVEIFYTQFRPRTQCIAGAFKKLIALVIFAIMTWQSLLKAAASMDSKEIIDVLDIPAYPFQLFVTLGVGVLCLQLVVDFLAFLKPSKGG